MTVPSLHPHHLQVLLATLALPGRVLVPPTRNGFQSWICTNRRVWRQGIPASRVAVATASQLRRRMPGRVKRALWVRYWISLETIPPNPPEVCLEPVTDEVIEKLRVHSDHKENQLASGLRWWDHGLRRAYLWQDEDMPLCIQWLLTADQEAAVRSLKGWAGMYPPLPEGRGQVENLFAFSGVRLKGVATRFEYALFHEARRAGMTELLTHIHESNGPAHAWATRTGWTPYGTIVRYEFDLSRDRRWNLYLHRVHEVDLKKLTGT